jgi:hypothetical protein
MIIRMPILCAVLFLFSFCGGNLHSAEPVAEMVAPSGEGWVRVSCNAKLSVYSRSKPGSKAKEYQAIGWISAPNWVVEHVLEDAEAYPRFMPYVVECRILTKEVDGVTTYQRISAPFISARDYVLRVRVEMRHSAAGTVFVRHWMSEPQQVLPERPGTIRVKVNEGSWTLEPAGESTHAIYSVFTDPGGTIPAGILNYANQSAIPKVFAAVEKQAAEKKYREKQPAK